MKLSDTAERLMAESLARAEAQSPEPLVTVDRCSMWTVFSASLLDDLRPMRAALEYQMSGGPLRPLTLRERITGRRLFVSSDDYELLVDVGWRWTFEAWRSRIRWAIRDRTPHLVWAWPHIEWGDDDGE